MNRPRLALAIPTLGRAETLEHNLRAIIDEARALGVPIHICDDAPDDAETEKRVKAVAQLHPRVSYQRNNPTLGHDSNLMRTLSLPDSDYVWLLADSLMIKPGELTRIYDSLGDDDFIFLNAIVGEKEAAQYVGAEAETVITELMWNLALTGATVYHRRVIDWAQRTQPSIKRNFPQLSVILDYATNFEVRATWIARLTMISLPKLSYWRANSVFRNWIDDWANVVVGYPKLIGPNRMSRAFQCHARGTGIFSAESLLRFRAEGQFERNDLGRPHFWDVVPTRKPIVLGVLALPRAAAAGLVRAGRRLRSLGLPS